MSHVLDVLVGLIGLALVALAINDVFKAVVVPRSVDAHLRASAFLGRRGWQLWRDACLRISDAEVREDRMAMFAPLLITSYLILWVSMLVFGYGLIFWALRAGIRPHPDFGSAIYFAATSLLTIGYGDFVPHGSLARTIAMISATTGLGVVAIVATFLFQTFTAFQRREAFVVTVSERTGAPPSGPEFIARHVKLGLTADIPVILREAQRWIAEVLETHLAYPVLLYFRSSHDDESWVGTLGALLDASTLLITTADMDNRGQAELTLQAGSHLVHDFTTSFGLPMEDTTSVEYEEFAQAYRELAALGCPMQPLEDAWPRFSTKRATYAAALDAMARWQRIPPARWIGDRSRVRSHVNAGVMQEPVA